MVLDGSLLPLRVHAPEVGDAYSWSGRGGFDGEQSGLWEVRVSYMNVGRSCDATHEFLEGCARNGVGVAFVGECWVEHIGGRVHSRTLIL